MSAGGGEVVRIKIGRKIESKNVYFNRIKKNGNRFLKNGACDYGSLIDSCFFSDSSWLVIFYAMSKYVFCCVDYYLCYVERSYRDADGICGKVPGDHSSKCGYQHQSTNIIRISMAIWLQRLHGIFPIFSPMECSQTKMQELYLLLGFRISLQQHLRLFIQTLPLVVHFISFQFESNIFVCVAASVPVRCAYVVYTVHSLYMTNQYSMSVALKFSTIRVNISKMNLFFPFHYVGDWIWIKHGIINVLSCVIWGLGFGVLYTKQNNTM